MDVSTFHVEFALPIISNLLVPYKTLVTIPNKIIGGAEQGNFKTSKEESFSIHKKISHIFNFQ